MVPKKARLFVRDLVFCSSHKGFLINKKSLQLIVGKHFFIKWVKKEGRSVKLLNYFSFTHIYNIYTCQRSSSNNNSKQK
jgi:hypothetical protein